MPQTGYDPFTCLRFDVACVEYEGAWEREKGRTVQVPVPSGKRRPTMPAPAHTPDVLLQLLGIDPQEARGAGLEIDERTEELADEILTGAADWLLNP